MAGKKLFVGGLPHMIDADSVRSTFGEFGVIEDVYIKPNCDPSRQWAFVTFDQPAAAQNCKAACDRLMTFPGMDRPVEMTFAKNQGMYGQDAFGRQHTLPGGQPANPHNMMQQPGGHGGYGGCGGGYGGAPGYGKGGPSYGGGMEAPKKVFVGTLPDGTTEQVISEALSVYGHITDIYLKPGCEPGRQWGFVTFASSADAQNCKISTDRILVLPGGSMPIEVTFAKNQGLNGEGTVGAGGGMMQPYGGYQQGPGQASAGGRKIFVGSLPDGTEENTIRAEFSRYGHIQDVFVKPDCPPGKQWCFVTFATEQEAMNAKASTDKVLLLPGGEKACEVMIARPKNETPAPGAMQQQQQYGFASRTNPPPSAGGYAAGGYAAAGFGGGGAWKMYFTSSGLPYYHNHATGHTQWEAPPEMRNAGGSPPPPSFPPPHGKGFGKRGPY
eukprot:TRINITY_DN121577_c0_g1_i1.p1 TRINITY_DN121577_c0_g1~~TRINITY_DN121577_c0_g1_i1.p1  ORF type:complete len:468 (-),score=90.77 TRINITY_DN121577_c0_g1_i1:96-1418(-)